MWKFVCLCHFDSLALSVLILQEEFSRNNSLQEFIGTFETGVVSKAGIDLDNSYGAS